MKNILLATITFSLLLLTTPTPASALDIYISPDGNDDNQGTLTQPFKTVIKAQQKVREIITAGLTEPVTINLRSGTYELASPIVFESHDSGTSVFPITWQSFPQERAIISGGQKFTGWQLDGDLWKAQFPGNFPVYTLFINNQRGTRARIETGLNSLQKTDRGYSNVTDNIKLFLLNKKDAQVVIRYEWRQFRCPIDRLEGNTLILQQPCWKNVLFNGDGRLPDPKDIGAPSWIEHTKEAIDQPGEWYFDKDSREIWYKPRPGDQITNVQTVIPMLESLIFINPSVSNLIFNNLDFANTTWKEPFEIGRLGYFIYSLRIYDDLTLPLPGQQKKINPEAIRINGAKNISFTKNRFYNLGSGGIGLIDTDNNSIHSNLFTDLDSQAISLHGYSKSTSNNTISQNIIKNIGVGLETTSAIFLGNGSEHTEIKNNIIIDVPYSGVVVQNTGNPNAKPISKIHIYRNRIIRAVNVLPLDTLFDGGSIYVTHRLTDTIIEENFITGQLNKYAALYLDQSSQYITIQNNVLFNNQRTALLKGGDNIVRDNWWEDRHQYDVRVIPVSEDRVCTAHPELNCHTYTPTNNHPITSLAQAPQSIQNNAGVTISTFDILKPKLSLVNLSTGDIRIKWNMIPGVETYILHIDSETINVPGYKSSYTLTPVSGRTYNIWMNVKFSPELIGSESNHLTYPTTLPGDLNSDGKVDLFDYNLLVSKFGNPYTIFNYNTLVVNYEK